MHLLVAPLELQQEKKVIRRRSGKQSNQIQSYLKELAHNPGTRHRQLCPDSIGLPLHGGKGSLGGAQGDLQTTTLTGRLRIAVHCRVLLAEIMVGVVSIIGVRGIIRNPIGTTDSVSRAAPKGPAT